MIINKIGAVVTTGALFAMLATGAFASTTVTVSGNGSKSVNGVAVVNASSTTVTQSNTSVVTNIVSSNASTGGNKANGNTGGSTSVSSGTATSTVAIVNGGNTNTVTTAPSCAPADTTVDVKNNGHKSVNGVLALNLCSTSVSQSNTNYTFNAVSSNAATGGNQSNNNTGKNASNTVSSGDATSTVGISNTGSTNTL